jgi:plastocyanin
MYIGMRKIVVLTIFLLLLLLISPIAGARHEAYSVAPSSDEGIYSFFSDVIRDTGICLDNFVDESPDADTRASRLESVVKLAVEESRYYAVRGFESNVSRVVQPFSAPSDGVKKLTTYQLVFLTNYEILKNESDYSAYVEARTAIVKMRSGADAINSSLERIELIELWNETSTLNFNVSDLSERLIDVYALIDHYERLLEQYKVEAHAFEEDILVVVVSDEHPLLYEEITIHIYAKNTTTLSLFIDDEAHSLKNQTADPKKKHRFENPGEHDIYAEGRTVDGKNIKSNIVKVHVSKIPTFIVLSSQYSALLNESVKITGLIVDYYDKPLHTVNVTVEACEEETVTTDVRGRFVFYGTRSSEGYLNVSAFYPGNGTYKSSSADLSIFFSRFPISLQIAANTTEINVNETVKFMGSVSGISTNYTIPLSIFVNGRGEGTIIAEKDFEFSLSFSQSGTYEVYTLFPGDSFFKDAKSNEVTITVTEKAGVAGVTLIGEITANIFGVLWLIANPRSYLFSMDAGLEEELKEGIIPEKMKQEFESKGIFITYPCCNCFILYRFVFTSDKEKNTTCFTVYRHLCTHI